VISVRTCLDILIDVLIKLTCSGPDAISARLLCGHWPNASPLSHEAEPILLTELGKLTDHVVGDDFESFSKHSKDIKERTTTADSAIR